MLTTKQLDEFKPWLISVAKTGSRTLPWIEQPRDTDYIFYVKDLKDGKLMSKLFSMKSGECWGVSLLRPFVGTFAYEYSFANLIYGDELPKFDIFEHRDEYAACLVRKGLGDKDKSKKSWYHILTGIYMLDNCSYILTEQQKTNINLCHQKNTSDEIYDFIQERLSQYKLELGDKYY